MALTDLVGKRFRGVGRSHPIEIGFGALEDVDKADYYILFIASVKPPLKGYVQAVDADSLTIHGSGVRSLGTSTDYVKQTGSVTFTLDDGKILQLQEVV